MSDRTPEQDAANLAQLQDIETAHKEQAPAIIDPHAVAAKATVGTYRETSVAPSVIDPRTVAARAAPQMSSPTAALPVSVPITGGDPQDLKLNVIANDRRRLVVEEVVKPVGVEQLERSEKMIRDFGNPHSYMASLDQRDPSDRPRAVPGVGFSTADVHDGEILTAPGELISVAAITKPSINPPNPAPVNPNPDSRPNPSLFPSNWGSMTEDERASWEAATHSTIDPHKVAATPARGV